MGRFPQILDLLSGFEWSSQRLSGGNLEFDFVDERYARSRGSNSRRKLDLLAPGGMGDRPTAPTPLATALKNIAEKFNRLSRVHQR